MSHAYSLLNMSRLCDICKTSIRLVVSFWRRVAILRDGLCFTGRATFYFIFCTFILLIVSYAELISLFQFSKYAGNVFVMKRHMQLISFSFPFRALCQSAIDSATFSNVETNPRKNLLENYRLNLTKLRWQSWHVRDLVCPRVCMSANWLSVS
jgi:hypothetical protein